MSLAIATALAVTSGGSAGASGTARTLFGASLVLAVDSDHVTTSGGNVTSATDQSGAGNNLTNTGTITLGSGGIKGRPFATMANATFLATASNLVASGANRTVYHVFQSVTSSQTLLRFRSGTPDYAVRFSSGLGTTSDESTFNNTGTYTYDTTTVHIVESQYHLGAVSTYVLDGAVITQGGATVSTSDTGTAGFQINQGAAAGGQLWYATFVVNRLTTGPEDAAMLTALQAVY